MNEPPKKFPAFQKKSWLGLLKFLYRQTSPTAGCFALGFCAIFGALLFRFFPVQYSDSEQITMIMVIGFMLLGVGFLRIFLRGKFNK